MADEPHVGRAGRISSGSSSSPNQQPEISILYTSIDGVRKRSKYRTLAGAKKYAHRAIGEHPELGSTYAVSADGIGKIEVEGVSLGELFPPSGDLLDEVE